MRLKLPYPPSANTLKAIVRGRMVKTAKARQYAEACALLAKSQLGPGFKPLDGEVRLFVYVRRPRKQGDLDNTLKAIQDALKGILWVDDSQVVELHAYRNDDKVTPGVQVFVEPRILPFDGWGPTTDELKALDREDP